MSITLENPTGNTGKPVIKGQSRDYRKVSVIERCPLNRDHHFFFFVTCYFRQANDRRN